MTGLKKVPGALVIFNRPMHTRRVVEAIHAYGPAALYVIADGPRGENERENCIAARAVIDEVTWECPIEKNYSEVNLGCRIRVSSGLDWVFDRCEAAIVLEDDCLPHPSFFEYCAELLSRYQDDERVMLISGYNYLSLKMPLASGSDDYSYRFSRYGETWGWASWRRAWQFYDLDMSLWPMLRRDPNWLLDITGDPDAAGYWRMMFDRIHADGGTTWDFQWRFALWAQNALDIVPRHNLISNIGFGADATHTVDLNDSNADAPVTALRLPLSHPVCMARDLTADRQHFIARVGWKRSAAWKRTGRAFVERLPSPLPQWIERVRAPMRRNA